MGINVKLVARRKALGLSQVQLAKRIGFSQVHISRFESGHYEPSDKYLCALEAIAAAMPPRDDDSATINGEAADQYYADVDRANQELNRLFARFQEHWKRDPLAVVSVLSKAVEKLDSTRSKRLRVLENVDGVVGLAGLSHADDPVETRPAPDPEFFLNMLCHECMLSKPEGAADAAKRVLEVWEHGRGKWEALNALLKFWNLELSDERVSAGGGKTHHPLQREMVRVKAVNKRDPQQGTVEP